MCYESKTLTFVLRSITDGGVFVDVGANIGGYTIRAAKKARVYALEPHPRNFQLLAFNVKLNDRQNYVKTLRTAAASYVGKAKLVVSNYHGRHSLLESRSRMEPRNHLTIEVDATTLDSILVGEDHVDIIKIDVEGAEPLVLKGAEDALKRTKIVIIESTLPSSFYNASKILVKKFFKPQIKFESENNVAFIRT
jgi:FkbM family methyltransferase